MLKKSKKRKSNPLFQMRAQHDPEVEPRSPKRTRHDASQASVQAVTPTRLIHKIGKQEWLTPNGRHSIKATHIQGVYDTRPASSPLKPRQDHITLGQLQSLDLTHPPTLPDEESKTTEITQTMHLYRRDFMLARKAGTEIKEARRRKSPRHGFKQRSAKQIAQLHGHTQGAFDFNHLLGDRFIAMISGYIAKQLLDNLRADEEITNQTLQTYFGRYFPNEVLIKKKSLSDRYKKIHVQLISLKKAFTEKGNITQYRINALIQQLCNVISGDSANLFVATQAQNTATMTIEQLVVMLLDPKLAGEGENEQKYFFAQYQDLKVTVKVSVAIDKEKKEDHFCRAHTYQIFVFTDSSQTKACLSFDFKLQPQPQQAPPSTLLKRLYERFILQAKQYLETSVPQHFSPLDLELEKWTTIASMPRTSKALSALSLFASKAEAEVKGEPITDALKQLP